MAGCAPQPATVTAENYAKIEFGMHYAEVVDILGMPQQTHPIMAIEQFTWVNGDRHIHAKFIFDRAFYYSSRGLQSR